MAKYDHIPLAARELVRTSDLNEYLDARIDLCQLRTREEGTDRWQATRLLMGGLITVGQFQAIEPAYKTDHVAAFLWLAKVGRTKP